MAETRGNSVAYQKGYRAIEVTDPPTFVLVSAAHKPGVDPIWALKTFLKPLLRRACAVSPTGAVGQLSTGHQGLPIGKEIIKTGANQMR